MLNAIGWIMPITLLTLGAVILGRTVREYSVSRTITRRLREHVSPQLAAPWIEANTRHAFEWLGRRVAGTASIKTLQGLLLQAGYMQPSMPYIVAAVRFVAVLSLFAATLFWNTAKQGTVTPQGAAAAFFFSAILYRAFSLVLKGRGAAREREIRRELPYVLDLILMVLDSGVSIDQALHHVCGQIGHAAPICGKILSRYIGDTEDGMPYDMALERLAQRLVINEGRDFAAVLKQNLFQGGELNPPLQRLSTDVGEARLAMAREQVGRKSVLLTLVMLAFFMPVLMVALAGPAVSDLLGTLANVAHDLEASRMKR